MRSTHVAVILAIILVSASLLVLPSTDVRAEGSRLHVDLNDTDASFLGGSTLEYAGFATSFVGDVNGDGYDDLAVGAPYNEDVGVQAGKVYLVFGASTGWDMDTPLANANATFLAENEYDLAGMYLSGGCDVNTDGYDDIVVSALRSSEAEDSSGKVYIIMGKPSGWAKDVNISTAAQASFTGEAQGDQAGTVSCAEDVNGDGFDDVLIGVPENDEGGKVIRGQTYIVFGRSGGWSKGVSLANVNASIWGEALGDKSGSSLAGVGDVNGDGYGDFVIGAPDNLEGGGQGGNTMNQAGQVYLFFGRSSGWSMDMNMTAANASFWGQVGEHLGRNLDGAGDVNGDGFTDLVIGTPYTGKNLTGQGRVYIVLGKASGWSMDTILEGSCDGSFLGSAQNERAGNEVSGAGDFNGDGYDDILIGTPFPSRSAYIVFGKTQGWSRDGTLANADMVLNGTQLRGDIDGGADFNGDGLADIVLSNANDDEAFNNGGQVYLTYGFQLTEPTGIEDLRIYSDDQYSDETTWTDMLWTVYYEVLATGGDQARMDSLLVNISSETSDPEGFQVRLYETGLDTNAYRGYLVVRDTTNAGKRWIHAGTGEHIRVSAVKDPAKNDTVLVGQVTITPDVDHETTVEDMEYSKQFIIENDTDVEMTIETDADWLRINDTYDIVRGTPDNTDIGTWQVNVTADDGHGNMDGLTFDIEVVNVAPEVLTDPVFEATENVSYRVDFNSSDDGQGDMTWALETNASWLDLDNRTGVVQGLPQNHHVGHYWVYVSVGDGNGGTGSVNYTLTVKDVNEPPAIVTEDRTVAREDERYMVNYDVEDIDLLDNDHTWELDTDADWLSIHNKTGVIYGEPTNDQVGSYWVNVSVRDRKAAGDWSNFTLEVLNTPPSILTEDVTKVLEEERYSVHYTSDDDGQGEVSWSMTTDAPWLELDPGTNNLTGIPGNGDVGRYRVEITVDDGNGGTDTTNFSLEVVNVNDRPTLTPPPVLNATVDGTYHQTVGASDVDRGDDLNFSLAEAPAGMTIDNISGLISWVPVVGQEGENRVVAEVNDGTVTVRRAFNITVWPHLVVNVTRPAEGQGVSGRYKVSGTASGPADLTVEIAIDDGEWVEADGSNTWSHKLDTGDLSEGQHTLRVRSSWNDNVSEEASVTFEVERPEEGLDVMLVLVALVIAVVVAVVVALFLLKRRGGGGKEAPGAPPGEGGDL